MKKAGIKRILLIAAGTAALGFGTVGLIIPVLPTTPFLLLACWCFMGSSKRLHDWLIQHKVLGKYIYNYMTYKAVTKRAKILSLIFLWLGLSVSIYLISLIYIKLLLVAVGIAVSVHLLSLKTM